MLLDTKDIRKEQREEQHIIFLVKVQRFIIEVGNKQDNVALKTILVPIVYNSQKPHQNINQLLNIFIETFTFYIITFSYSNGFCSNPSPSEDNQSSLGTDLNIINTEDEMHIDITNWTPVKWKKLQHIMKNTSRYLGNGSQFVLS